MRRVSHLFWSTSALAAMALASPASAQDQPAATAADRTAQPPPADQADAGTPASQAETAIGSGSEIIVTGLRRSLQTARNIKRNSTQIIDAVVAEDIGKLPDITVSDTAARIPAYRSSVQGAKRA